MKNKQRFEQLFCTPIDGTKERLKWIGSLERYLLRKHESRKVNNFIVFKQIERDNLRMI